MPLKRVTPSFTVEYLKAKRTNSGSAKSGWGRAKPAPAGLDEKANRIAISAFKTVAVKPPAEVIAPSIPSGRILPSLVETTPVTGQAGAQSRSYGGAALAGHATQVAVDGAVARQLDEHTYSVEGLEASVAAILRLKQPTTSDLSVRSREGQGRRNGPDVLQKSKRSSTTFLGRPPKGVNLHR